MANKKLTKAENYPDDKIGASSNVNEEIIKIAMERWRQSENYWKILRDEALEDLTFFNGQQWLENVLKDRSDDRRPALTVNRLPAFVNQVVNDMKQNLPQIKVRPVESSDEDSAEVVDGLIRNIMKNGDSRNAIDNATLYQVINGFGYFRVVTDWCDEKSWDQEIKLERIQDPFSVYLPMHLTNRLDYSDMPYAFIRYKYSKEDFKRMYPDSKTANWELQGTGDPNWMEDDYVYLCEYFDVVKKKEMIYLLSNGKTVTGKKPENLLPGISVIKERETVTSEIHVYKMTQYDILEEKIWPGKYIPIIPVMGQELSINGRKVYWGLVRFAKDPQRMYNFWLSSYTEEVMLQPLSPWLVEEDQVSEYKMEWQVANVKNLAYLTYKHRDGVPPPQRIQPPQASSATINGMNIAVDNLKAVTGIFDASLGARGNETSGRAIIARQKQGDTSNYHFLENQATAIRHLGRILIDLIPEIYDMPRSLRILGEDMTDKIVHVNQQHPENNGKIYDLSLGKYDVSIDIGPGYDTKRVETAQNLINMIQAVPQLGAVTGDIIMRALDFPLSQEAAERIKRFINAQFPGIIPDDEKMGQQPTEDDVRAIVADLQKIQQAHQLSLQQIAQLNQIIQTLQVQLKDKSEERQLHMDEVVIRANAEMQKAKIGAASTMQQEHVRQAPKMIEAANNAMMANIQEHAGTPVTTIIAGQPQPMR